jgi:hypothetical protein
MFGVVLFSRTPVSLNFYPYLLIFLSTPLAAWRNTFSHIHGAEVAERRMSSHSIVVVFDLIEALQLSLFHFSKRSTFQLTPLCASKTGSRHRHYRKFHPLDSSITNTLDLARFVAIVERILTAAITVDNLAFGRFSSENYFLYRFSHQLLFQRLFNLLANHHSRKQIFLVQKQVTFWIEQRIFQPSSQTETSTCVILPIQTASLELH